MHVEGFWYHILRTASVEPLNPQKDQNICIPPCLIIRHSSPVQYTKNIDGMASPVDAIRKILEKYNNLRQYRILFGTCSCKVVDRKERKKLMIKHKEENNTIKQWSQQRKNILGEKTI